MSDFSDDSDDAGISESGSPTTVSRRLLEPVLLETIRNMNACKPSVNKASTLTCFTHSNEAFFQVACHMLAAIEQGTLAVLHASAKETPLAGHCMSFAKQCHKG